MPRRRRRGNRSFGNRVHDRLSWSALRPEIQDASQQHAGVEKGYGHRFRSSSTSAAMSRLVRVSFGAVGRATVRRPTFTSRGPGATRCSRMPNSSAETSSSAPALNPILSRSAAGITTRPALSMVVRMVIEYHGCWLLAAGCWLLAAGAAGGYGIRDRGSGGSVGLRLPDVRRLTLTGNWKRGPGNWSVSDSRRRQFRSGSLGR
jgi:hypothetical protein